MITENKRTDVFWGYVAQGLNVGAGLLLLPAVLRSLSPADVGLWFVFITLGSFAQLAELGFQPTIARNATYVFAGARSLEREGLPADSKLKSGTDICLLAKLICCAREIYRWVALVSAVLLLAGGSVYVYSILIETQNKLTTILAWGLFALGHVFTFYFGYINALLQGRGDISQANKVIVITRGGLIILGTFSLLLDHGLLGLGLASLLSALLGRIFAIRYMIREPITKAAIAIATSKHSRELLQIMWHNAKKTAAVQLSAFVIQRSNVLIGTSILGTIVMASYSMTLAVLMALSSISSVICQIKLPYLISLQVENKIQQIRNVYIRIVFISAGLFVLGSAFLWFFGNLVLSNIGSTVVLLPRSILSILVVVVLLEMHHVIAATYITTMNSIPFVRSAIFSALLTLILSFVLIKPLGVLGLVVAQGVAQLLYNNWKWPLVAYRHLYKINYNAL